MTRRRRRARSALLLLAMALAGVAAGRVVVLVLDGRAAPVTAPAVSPATVVSSATVAAPLTATSRAVPSRAARGVRVLHGWDAERAAAYARGDPAALRGLYVPGSRAGRRDVAVLEAYADRGLFVRDLRTQVLAVRVRAQEDRRLVLRVTDRVVGGRAVARHRRGTDRGLPLPYDAPSTRVVALERSGEGWRVVSVRDG